MRLGTNVWAGRIFFAADCSTVFLFPIWFPLVYFQCNSWNLLVCGKLKKEGVTNRSPLSLLDDVA